jgi:hypothetical protein
MSGTDWLPSTLGGRADNDIMRMFDQYPFPPLTPYLKE